MTISRTAPFARSTDKPLLGRSGQWLGAMGLVGALMSASVCADDVKPLAMGQRLEQRFDFDIPAQSLAGALIAFGQQAGIQISSDSALLRNRDSVGARGTLSARDALVDLLHGSGVRWHLNPAADTLILEEIPVTEAYRQSTHEVLVTENIVVLGTPQESGFQGETVIDRRAIEAFPGANGDITTLLQMHPSVKFRADEKSSNTAGEIDPADISINGAKYYQNNFMIDGISINNDLDPGSHTWNDYNSIEGLPSRAHGIALDADQLESVKVYDSNVPAEFGGFNGGVVDAITRRPTEDLHGKVSMSMTRSSWTQFHIADDQRNAFEQSSDAQNQPEFRKFTYKATLEGHLTENFGLMANFSRKTSIIPLNAYDNGYQSGTDDGKHDQRRQIDNYVLKGFWNPSDRLETRFNLTHAPQEGEYFRANTRNSATVIHQGGYQASLQAIWLGDQATYTHKLAYTNLESSRTSDSNVYKAWRWSEAKNWGNPYRNGVLSTAATSAEGGMGELTQTQVGATYSLKADWLPVQLWGTTHNFQTGLELSQQTATYERPGDVWTATTLGVGASNGSLTCNTASGALDSEYCSISRNALGALTRQYFRNLNYYREGKIELTERRYGLFAQDKIELGKLTLRPGLRLDADDYMEKKTLAPRFSAEYDVFADRSTVLTGGLNRYYGRNLFIYRLADGRESLRWRRTRGASTGTTIQDFAGWVNYGVDENSFRKLDIPYDDEVMLGISQRWLDTTFDLKYVHRQGKDQVVRSTARNLDLPTGDGVTTIANYYTYTNKGKSESDNVSLTVSPDWRIKGLGTSTSMQLALDWNRTRSTHTDYQQVLSASEVDDNDVIYDGKVTAYSELPTSDFNRPWTARLTTITDLPALHLTWSNFLRYRGPYQQIVNTGKTASLPNAEGGLTTYDVYEAATVKAAPTWDTRLYWELPTAREQALFAAVDITNVLDKVSPIVSYSGTTTYEIGRQYWLEVGYRF
ncbi:TonB-dependent receptor plug domain-containing protein [Pseudomonas asplenii]|uniref:TonB-dependent receptor plug domain-containing protein n=1 Tax=Pseudomonas asplenii TaxID=53407 RepID=UPI00235E6D8A|nr:TonB-dependent receptor plug domain-containing protein [Pseudomonas asplenii]